jgi:hypothetical protein
MTDMMKGAWARQEAVAGVRSPFTTRVDLYTSANAAGSGIDQTMTMVVRGDACAARHLN